MFAIINSPIIILSKRKFILVYPFPLLHYCILVSLVSYRTILKVNALNIMRSYMYKQCYKRTEVLQLVFKWAISILFQKALFY